MNNKIRILFIHSYLMCGGAEQALFDLVSLMDKTKFDITVMPQYDGGVWEEKFRNAGIRVVTIWDNQDSSGTLSAKFKNTLYRIKIRKILKQGGKNIISTVFSEKFDIVVSYHVNSMHDMGYSSNSKTVKYIHGDIRTNPGYRDIVMRALPWIRKSDKIICVSDTARKSFEAETKINRNVVAHFNPLNSQNIQRLATDHVQWDYDVPVMCAVGRLAKEKGYERLIRIHKEILDSGIAHKLIIVGDGPEKENLSELITNQKLQNSVLMMGYQANPYPYMAHSDFVICSSYTEGLPVISMEALCLGIPIVSSVPSIGELFSDKICGIITENDDKSLAEGIYRMLTDSDFYEKAKHGAMERSAYFDGKRMVKEIEQEFESLVSIQ